jgi:hypothetical protein
LKEQALLRRAYEAFNARDIDGALALLSDLRVRHAYTFRDGLVERMDIEEAMQAKPSTCFHGVWPP